MPKKPTSKSSRHSLLAIPVHSRKRRTWDESLPAHVRTDLEDVRDGMLSGEIRHSIEFVFEHLKKQHKEITVGLTAFQNYLRRGRTQQ
jgi:hypothetical protein